MTSEYAARASPLHHVSDVISRERTGANGFRRPSQDKDLKVQPVRLPNFDWLRDMSLKCSDGKISLVLSCLEGSCYFNVPKRHVPFLYRGLNMIYNY